MFDIKLFPDDSENSEYKLLHTNKAQTVPAWFLAYAGNGINNMLNKR